MKQTLPEHENDVVKNRRLESRMTSLCESPFINDAFQHKERIDKLLTLEKRDTQQRTQIEHLQVDGHNY